MANNNDGDNDSKKKPASNTIIMPPFAPVDENEEGASKSLNQTVDLTKIGALTPEIIQKAMVYNKYKKFWHAILKQNMTGYILLYVDRSSENADLLFFSHSYYPSDRLLFIFPSLNAFKEWTAIYGPAMMSMGINEENLELQKVSIKKFLQTLSEVYLDTKPSESTLMDKQNSDSGLIVPLVSSNQNNDTASDITGDLDKYLLSFQQQIQSKYKYVRCVLYTTDNTLGPFGFLDVWHELQH